MEHRRILNSVHTRKTLRVSFAFLCIISALGIVVGPNRAAGKRLASSDDKTIGSEKQAGLFASDQTLLQDSGTFPEQNYQGQRQSRAYGQIAVPRSGRISIVVTSTPNVRQEIENITRYDSAVWKVNFNGEDIPLTPDFPECNPPGSNPAICTSKWDPPSAGTLNFDLLGPAVYNIWGEFTGHAAQSYVLDVIFTPGPDVDEIIPDAGSTEGWDTVTVRGNGFAENAVVLFGGTAATETVVVSAQEILCKTPPGVPGATDVLVLNPDPEELRWNFGRPWGLFGELPNGFTYQSPNPPPALQAERLIGTYAGFFKEQDWRGHQQSEEFDFTIPGAGRLRWEAWAFIPILGPVYGPPSDPLDFEAFNDSTAVRGFRRGDGKTASTNVRSTSLTYYYGPVISNSTQIVDVTGSGSGKFTVLGPASWSALDGFFLHSVFQDWTLAVWFADQPVVDSVEPDAGSPDGGTPVTVRGSHFADGARVRFGDHFASSVTVVDENTITCNTPMGEEGSVNVSVVLFTSLAGTFAGGFTYVGEAPTATPSATALATPTNTPGPGVSPTPTFTPVASLDPESLLELIEQIRRQILELDRLLELLLTWYGAAPPSAATSAPTPPGG